MVYLAEDEKVSIVPRFTSDKVVTMSGAFGPFKALQPVEVPLWLALSLRRRNRCEVQPPAWLNADTLADALEEDRNANEFHSLPFYYYEMAMLLLRDAREDVPRSERVRCLVEDLRAVRQNKLHSALAGLKERTLDVPIENISHSELNVVRPFMVKALGAYGKYSASEAAPGTQTQLADGVGYGAGDGSAEQRSQPRRLR